jgi:hypothetical protein
MFEGCGISLPAWFAKRQDNRMKINHSMFLGQRANLLNCQCFPQGYVQGRTVAPLFRDPIATFSQDAQFGNDVVGLSIMRIFPSCLACRPVDSWPESTTPPENLVHSALCSRMSLCPVMELLSSGRRPNPTELCRLSYSSVCLW